MRGSDAEAFVVVISCLTARMKWLDLIELRVCDGPEEGKCEIKAECKSTGVCPMIVPMAPVMNLFLFWIPFGDGGKCAQSLLAVRKALRSELNDEVESKSVFVSYSNPRKYRPEQTMKRD